VTSVSVLLVQLAMRQKTGRQEIRIKPETMLLKRVRENPLMQSEKVVQKREEKY